MLQRLLAYIKESHLELRRVTWPTRSETVRYTVAVILISGVVAIFLGALDYLFRFVLNTFIL